MKEEKLLRAIGQIDDELIDSAMETHKKNHPRRSWARWTAIAACLCLLLTVTVGAAKWDVEWWHGQAMGYIFPSGQESEWSYEPQMGNTVEWTYPFEPVTIRQEALDEMTEQLNQEWTHQMTFHPEIVDEMADTHYLTGLSHEVENRIYPIEERFTTIGELEEYLGIDLVTSPLIDAAAYNCMHTNDIGTWLEIGLYVDLYRDAAAEYVENGQIALQGIEITVRMGFSKTNCKSWMEIYIPLTEKFVETFPHEVLFNTEENSPFKVETQQFSGRNVIVVEDSNDDLEQTGCVAAYGVYGADGIGYCVHSLAEDWDNSEAHPTIYQSGAERLMELLEDLE